MRRAWWILIASLSLTACMNITTRLQPEDPTVKATFTGSDCVPIILGIGIGTADIAIAQGRAAPPDEEYGVRPLKKLKSVTFTYIAFMGFGAWCVEATGE